MRIIYTSDTHGHVFPVNYAKNSPEDSGLFCLAARIEKDGNTLVIDGGDSLQGTPLLTYYMEHRQEYDFHPMAEGFNAMGLDYYTLGNHDFNFGRDALLDYASYMKAGLVCANVEDLRGELDIKKHVIHVLEDGTRVGITGAVTGYVNIWEQKDNLKDLVISDPVDALRREYFFMKDRCDITLAIYHGGFEEDLKTGRLLSGTEENQACRIARELDFDILLTGHQHLSVPGLMLQGTWCLQPPDKAGSFCLLEAVKAGSGEGAPCWKISSHLVDAGEADEGYRLAEKDHAFMKKLTDNVEVWLDQPIGCLEEAILPEEKLDAALHGSKVAAIFNQVQLDYTGADFSCTSLANEALGLNKDVTVRDALSIYKFSNTLEVREVTGSVLRQALERCAEYFRLNEETGEAEISDAFLQPKTEHYNYDFYAGLDYAFDITRPVGDKVIRLRKLDGSEIGEREKYSLVTSNYRASGTGGYECIGKCRTLRTYADEVSDLLIRYLRSKIPVSIPENSRIEVRTGS